MPYVSENRKIKYFDKQVRIMDILLKQYLHDKYVHLAILFLYFML